MKNIAFPGGQNGISQKDDILSTIVEEMSSFKHARSAGIVQQFVYGLNTNLCCLGIMKTISLHIIVFIMTKKESITEN